MVALGRSRLLRDIVGRADREHRAEGPRAEGGVSDMATTTRTTSLRETAAWADLEANAGEIGGTPLRELFADDETRGERLALEAEGLYLDYSKNRIPDETIRLLIALAEERGVAGRRDAMFRGEHIN